MYQITIEIKSTKFIPKEWNFENKSMKTGVELIIKESLQSTVEVVLKDFGEVTIESTEVVVSKPKDTARVEDGVLFTCGRDLNEFEFVLFKRNEKLYVYDPTYGETRQFLGVVETQLDKNLHSELNFDEKFFFEQDINGTRGQVYLDELEDLKYSNDVQR